MLGLFLFVVLGIPIILMLLIMMWWWLNNRKTNTYFFDCYDAREAVRRIIISR